MPRPRVLGALALAVLAGAVALLLTATRPAPPEAAPPPAPSAPPEAAPSAPVAVVDPAPATGSVLAHRRYEVLLHGQRATTIDVVWTQEELDGRPVVKDVSRFRSRTVRDMAGVREAFESETVSTTIRTEDGILLSMDTVVAWPSRTDRDQVRPTDTGYAVVHRVGDQEETFEIAASGPAHVDTESFLGPMIRAGKATPGNRFRYDSLSLERRRLVPVEVEVIGADGTGLKVAETAEDRRTLWWFDGEGAVVAQQAGDTTIRRADDLDPDDLPSAAAVFPVTLRADRDLPRIFTARSLVVDVVVRTDDTVEPPRIPANPFTEVVEESEDRVRVRCVAYDDPAATAQLPMETAGLEEHLAATPLMEVNDPRVRGAAYLAVGAERDARAAAARIADWVFRFLRKGSPDIPDPTAVQILQEGTGDCSEHALLFTALCRAAGIPARRCQGWVCIGSDWGAHAWCEIWLGKWIGADPTTNEIGTRARYVFTGRQDDREMRGAVIHPGRTRLLIRSAEWADGAIDFTKGPVDPVVLSGIRLGPLPEGWTERRSGGQLFLSGPSATVHASIRPDHGYRSREVLGRHGLEERTFAGRPAFVAGEGGMEFWLIPLGREHLEVQVQATAKGRLARGRLEELFRPTIERAE